MTTDLEDDEPKKTPRATIVRRALVGALALACAGGWIYTRWLVKKETLGGPCSYDMHCRTEAPRCLKQSTEGEGICSRPCDTDGDCATDITCVTVELGEYDERGTPIKGGYCFPQAILDARKKKKPTREGGAPPLDSILDVPCIAGQLEGEIVLERGAAKTVYEVKGSLLRLQPGAKHTRTIVDTSTLRVYSVDDEKKTFSATQIGATPGEPKITKTDRRDRVANYDCEIWQIEEGRSQREACVVKGGAFIDPTRAATAWEKELAVRSVFAIRVNESDKPRVVATKVDVHPLDASLFAISKSYRNLAAR